MIKTAKNVSLFYGWVIVAASFAITMTLGETFWSFGVFFKPLETEFGWNRSITSTGFTAFLIGYAISSVLAGRISDRYNPRLILVISAFLAGAGISLCGQVQSIDQFRILFFIVGLGAGATWSVPTSIVQRWFYQRNRAGLALSIVVAGVGTGAMIFAPLINYFIISFGWRTAYLLVGIIFFLIIFLASLLIKRVPTSTEITPQPSTATKSANHRTQPISKVLMTSSFITTICAISLGIFAFQGVLVHFVPYAVDAGISPTVAAGALGLMGGFSVPGRIFSGFIADRIGWQKTMSLSLFGMALSMFWLPFIKVDWMLYCFIFFMGFFHGVRAPANVGIMGEFFGISKLGELIGITNAAGQFIGALAPFFTGLSFDITGSYSTAFLIVAMLLFSAGVTAFAAKKPLSKSD